MKIFSYFSKREKLLRMVSRDSIHKVFPKIMTELEQSVSGVPASKISEKKAKDLINLRQFLQGNILAKTIYSKSMVDRIHKFQLALKLVPISNAQLKIVIQNCLHEIEDVYLTDYKKPQYQQQGFIQLRELFDILAIVSSKYAKRVYIQYPILRKEQQQHEKYPIEVIACKVGAFTFLDSLVQLDANLAPLVKYEQELSAHTAKLFNEKSLKQLEAQVMQNKNASNVDMQKIIEVVKSTLEYTSGIITYAKLQQEARISTELSSAVAELGTNTFQQLYHYTQNSTLRDSNTQTQLVKVTHSVFQWIKLHSTDNVKNALEVEQQLQQQISESKDPQFQLYASQWISQLKSRIKRYTTEKKQTCI